MGGGGESKRKTWEALFAALFNSLLAVSRGVSGMHQPPLCSGRSPGCSRDGAPWAQEHPGAAGSALQLVALSAA